MSRDRVAHREPILRRRTPAGRCRDTGRTRRESRPPSLRRSARAPRAAARSRRPPPARARRRTSIRTPSSLSRCDDRSARRAAHLAQRDELALRARACRARCRPRMCVSLSPSTALSSTPARCARRARAPTRSRFGEAVEGVVIGERDGGEPDALRLANDVGRRARAVGRRRMHVQIDEARRRRDRSDVVTPRSRLRATYRSAATAEQPLRDPRRSARRATARATACRCGE